MDNCTWRSGNHSVGLIVQIESRDFDRVGYCWMKGRLIEGDLAMAIRSRTILMGQNSPLLSIFVT
jgi:hypothetical protein